MIVIDANLLIYAVNEDSPLNRKAKVRGLIGHLGTGGNLTSDAHLAAMAIENGAELCSSDGDFARFPGLRWRNPLSS